MAEKTVPQPADNADATGRETTRADERYVAPPVDIYETTDGLVLLADLPGVNAAGLDIKVKDDILTLTGAAVDDMPGTPVYREYELVSFFRQFQIADTVDTERITAEMKNGVLKLMLPKAEAAKPRQIKVQVG